jgi:hypothetical protein
MTEMEVINIANEIYGKHTPWHGVQRQRLLMLAERLTEAERDACAALVDENAMGCENPIYRSLLQSNAGAIRERSKA